ncbi:WAS/WASL-interacting protein family member 1-like [Chamaea fasciata]|uniref:WAS/WASL-interacting protein family member 1-like n=1 Tax=Chamaea fasciata TaxID=190680 RepID=UPI00336A51E2
MTNRRVAHAAQEPHGHRQQTQGPPIPRERMRSPYFLSGKSSTKLSVSEGEALAFQHTRGLAVGVRKRGGARRGVPGSPCMGSAARPGLEEGSLRLPLPDRSRVRKARSVPGGLPALPAAGERRRGGLGRAGRGLDTAPPHRNFAGSGPAALFPRRNALSSPERRGSAPLPRGPQRSGAAQPPQPGPAPFPRAARSAPILRPSPRPHGSRARPGAAPKSFQVREPQLYRGRAKLGWAGLVAAPWLRSAPPLCPVPRRKWALPAPPRPARPLFPAPPAAPPPRPAGAARPQVRGGGDGTGRGGVPSERTGPPRTARAPAAEPGAAPRPPRSVGWADGQPPFAALHRPPPAQALRMPLLRWNQQNRGQNLALPS